MSTITVEIPPCGGGAADIELQASSGEETASVRRSTVSAPPVSSFSRSVIGLAIPKLQTCGRELARKL